MARLSGARPRAWRSALAGAAALLTLVATPGTAQAPDPSEVPEPISDNSFLIEEAYNQEPGVVQHINTFARADGGGAWAYSFTQEWPLRGRRNQVSYSVPVLRAEGGGTGVGDVALNYRYQLRGDGGAGVHVAPRLSLLLPTGDERQGRGAGGLGLQTNLPLSVQPDPRLALHANAGLTLTPRARSPAGARATTLAANLGASAVWLARPRFNLLVELVWVSSEEVVGRSATVRSESLVLSPGLRWAYNFASGLQIVPGVAYTVALSEAAVGGLFLYLSFEHPFRR